MAKITLEAVLALVNAGGWRISNGHMAKGIGLHLHVTGAEVLEDMLLLRNDKEVVASVSLGRLSIDVVNEARPCLINFDGPFMIRQQRKKIDGGGWHDVEKIGLLLSLIDEEAWAQYKSEHVVGRRKTDADAKVRAEEARDARIFAFLARQKEQIAGSRVVDLIGGPTSLTIKFDNGYELNIELDGDDTWDAWINVDGGGQKITLESGQEPS